MVPEGCVNTAEHYINTSRYIGVTSIQPAVQGTSYIRVDVSPGAGLWPDPVLQVAVQACGSHSTDHGTDTCVDACSEMRVCIQRRQYVGTDDDMT